MLEFLQLEEGVVWYRGRKPNFSAKARLKNDFLMKYPDFWSHDQTWDNLRFQPKSVCGHMTYT